jgi:type I restriction enzyme S subunit
MAGEWAETKLEDVSDDITVGFVGSMSSLFLDRGVPLLRGQNIQPGRLDLTNLKYISTETHRKWKKSALKAGDVAIVRVGYPGTSCVIPEGMGDLNAASLVIVRPNKGKLDSHFLCYVLNSELGKQLIRGRLVGSVQQVFNTGTAATLEVLLPPLAEQKAIAAVLGALDDKIELNRRMNATLEAMARALFQSWFVDFDPVRAKLDGRPPAALDPATAALFPEHLEDSPLGHIPKGWTAGKLGDIGTNSRRAVQPSDIAPNTPYIALEHMPRRCIALGDWDDSADVASGKSAFKKGEVLFGKLRPYFHKVGVAPFDGVCSTDILVLSPKSPEWFGFLLGHASSDELIQFTDLASTGTKMPRTNWSDISSFKVVLPPKPIAAAFTRIIQPMLDRIRANTEQSRTLATLRDTLLPKLLSGELSLAATDKESLSVQNPSKGG